jgi:hypothetical protein
MVDSYGLIAVTEIGGQSASADNGSYEVQPPTAPSAVAALHGRKRRIAKTVYIAQFSANRTQFRDEVALATCSAGARP